MLDNPTISHHIQIHIISVLLRQKTARFRDMRPPKVDSNLYSYHLRSLLKNDYVVKNTNGYQLGRKGLINIDRISEESMKPRFQPKVITMFLIQDNGGNVLLQKRTKQPFIDTWTLPNGKVHIDDQSIAEAASREVKEKIGLDNQNPIHAGDAYVRVFDSAGLLTSTLVHIFKFNNDEIIPSDNLKWIKPYKLAEEDLAPGVQAVATRTFLGGPFFFEEFEATFTY